MPENGKMLMYENISDGSAVCPLTEEQKGIYLECINNPDSVMYNVGVIFKMPEGVDTEKLKKALIAVIKSHKVLNTVIETPDGVPSMVYKNFQPEIAEKEIDDYDTENESFTKPFDLEKGPLYRFEICKKGNETAVLFDVHHTVMDGSSIGIFLRDVISFYEKGEIPDEIVSEFDISEEESKIKSTEEYRQALEELKNKYEGTDLDLCPASDVMEETEGRSEIVTKSTENVLTPEAVRCFVKSRNISENAFFLGAFAYTLSKFSGTKETFFATAHNGRSKRMENSVGMFVKTIPIYAEIDEESPVAHFLCKMYDEYYNEKHWAIVPFGEIASKYGAKNDVTFVFHGKLFEEMYLEGKPVSIVLLPRKENQVNLDMMVMDEGDKYRFMSHYISSVYTSEFAESFISAFLKIASEMLIKDKLADISLIDEKMQEILDGFNKTESAYEDDKTVVELFREQAKKTPDNICVVYNEKKLTYRETDEITDRLAKYLVTEGISRNKVVGVLIPRCEHMVICSLAILKAGGAYLPLDPTYPPERLNLMVRDSSAVMLIYDKNFSGIIDGNFKGLRISADSLYEVPECDVSLSMPSVDDLFVMLYTSGSTGMPKGVMFRHSNTLVTTIWVKKYFEINENSKVTSYASYGFDAHTFDIYPAITSGAELHIIGDDIRLDFLALRKYFNENKITHTVMTTQVGRAFALLGGFETLKYLSVAGEKLTPPDVPENIKMFNLYGPTEGSVITSAFLIDKKYKDVPIGKPVDNIKLYVLDKQDRVLPAGAVGELVISGPHVTGGYLNRPDKTAEAYGENHFSNEKGYERIYRTGDMVRLKGDGNLQFIGRRDAQVKVRGFRVELTEIEEIIRRFKGVKDATVVAFDDPAGGKFICAYVVSDEKINVDGMNEFIRGEKPPYMVPAVTVQIDKIPLNQNQKVNKKALPKPGRRTESTVPPENDLQQHIFDIVSEVIGTKEFGTDNDFYEVGLTSIGAVRLNVALAKAFDITVKNSDIKTYNTVRKMEKFIENNGKISGKYDIMPDYPISATQFGIFAECSSKPDTVMYNIPVLVKLGEKVDIDRAKAAVEAAVNAHPYIKATLFADSDGNIRAKKNDEIKPEIEIIKCSEVPEGGKLARPFKMLNSPLFRIEFYRTENGNYLFMDFHHIIFDGTSQAVFFSDVDRAYGGETLTPEQYSGFECALEEEKYRNSEHYTKAKEYYDGIFKGCESSTMPPKSPEECENKDAGSIRKILNMSFGKIKNYCEKNKTSLNAYFNAAFGFVLGKFSMSDDVVYTTVYNGRNDSRLANACTMLVKTLPVSVHTEGNFKIIDLVKTTEKQLIDSMNNDIYSFAEISSAYGIKADVLFVYQGDNWVFKGLCGEEAEIESVLPPVAKAPITVNVNIADDTIWIDAEYRKDMYCGELIESMISAFESAAASFCEKEKSSEISLLSEKYIEKSDKMNNTGRKFRNIPANKFIEEFAEKYPERTAVVGAGMSFTYGELNSAANKTANCLIKLGVKKDTVVGMILDRTPYVSIAEVGILKAGGAFLGILPDYPDDRIEFCLEDSESPVVITTEKIKNERKSLFEGEKPFKTVTIEEILQSEEDQNPNVEISPDALAYCIYTSGSTGRPKGVMIEHHNLANVAQPHDFTYRSYYGNESGQVGLALSSLSFDMSVFDNLVFLMNGKTVCIATDYDIHNPGSLAKLMIDNCVETIACTPSFITNYISIPEFREAVKKLYSIVVGAEAFPGALYDELRKINPNLHIINGYGPSECTITCCAKELKNGKKITIGGPGANTKCFVTDRYGNILPEYACGELVICGELVGRGYVKLPEKTKAAFYEINGEKAYKSGDTVRINKDGEIEFFGRIDNQVKLRGFRVELDEIEKTICLFDGVKQSKVLVRNNGSEDYLAAFFTADRQIDMTKLTDYMKSKLTYYMVPDVMAQLDAMPLTANGKIDKKSLPEIKKNAKKQGRKAPKKSLEQELCELFASVLNAEEFYADDNFFEMGRTSLSASKVTMQLMSKGAKVEYQNIFDNPTPEMLASFIESQKEVKASEIRKEETEKISEISELLKYNTLEYAKETERKPLGDVLLTGAVGFLGIHILRELIERKEGNIICLVRKGDARTPEIRLKNMLMYYFGEMFEDDFPRIKVLDADITDADLTAKLKGIHFETLINCAACVKHYAADDTIERINVHGVENLIVLAKERNAVMIQISTTSVPGVHTDETYKKQVKMHENELFVIDSMDNKYGLSKYHAELKMLDAIKSGMKGKIIRVGNLMGRHSDGEFQINFNTNAFLNALRGFAAIGKSPISHATDPMSFSPIDMTAKAVVLLAGTNDIFTAFHANSRFGFDEMQLIEASNNCGIKIKPVKDEEYYADYYRMLGDDRVNARLQGLVTNDRPDLHAVDVDNVFTANVLYRLGFSWPLPEESYLERTIESLMTLDYFDADDTEVE